MTTNLLIAVEFSEVFIDNIREYSLLVRTQTPSRSAKYCDHHVCRLYVCLSACLCARPLACLVKAPKSCRITPILRCLHWLRINERIEYKLLSLTYKALTITQPPYLHYLIFVQCPRSTRSSSVVTVAWPPTSSSLKITDRSIRYASPCLWNQLPLSLRQHNSGTSSSTSDSPTTSPITSSSSDSPLCSSITFSLVSLLA